MKLGIWLFLFSCLLARGVESQHERNWTIRGPGGPIGLYVMSYDPSGGPSDWEAPPPVRYVQFCFGPFGNACAKLGGIRRESDWRTSGAALFALVVITGVWWTHRRKGGAG